MRPVKTLAVPSVTTKALMRVVTMMTPLMTPRAAPARTPSGTAIGQGTPQACRSQPVIMAVTPPIAPTEMFICPMARTTICARPTTIQIETLRANAKMLKSEVKPVAV